MIPQARDILLRNVLTSRGKRGTLELLTDVFRDSGMFPMIPDSHCRLLRYIDIEMPGGCDYFNRICYA